MFGADHLRVRFAVAPKDMTEKVKWDPRNLTRLLSQSRPDNRSNSDWIRDNGTVIQRLIVR